jgi:hypothetical protein
MKPVFSWGFTSDTSLACTHSKEVTCTSELKVRQYTPEFVKEQTYSYVSEFKLLCSLSVTNVVVVVVVVVVVYLNIVVRMSYWI